jgi:hypothetical protein
MRINRLFCGVKCCRINLDLVMKSHRSVGTARFFVLINQFSSVSPKVVRVVSNGERHGPVAAFIIYTPRRAAPASARPNSFAAVASLLGKKKEKRVLAQLH